MRTYLTDYYTKYKAPFLYLFFGVCTTIINMTSYYVTYTLYHWSNSVSTILAWLLAVIGAYVTNKIWVFESKSKNIKVLLYEITSFFACRIATGLMDLIIMYVSVDLLSWDAMLMKALSNVLVIILNYVASKLFIFKKSS